jgi:L-ascorbate metabolism protein UlaG (beta-lactamase superfamily)
MGDEDPRDCAAMKGALTPAERSIPIGRPVRATAAITWIGHATVLLELDGLRLLFDPVLRHRIGPLVRIARRDGIDALGQIDYVLISHLHADHTDVRSLRRVARAIPVFAPHPSGRWLVRRGLRDVRELRPGTEASVDGVVVRATPATHDPRRGPFGPAAEPIGYLASGSRSVYFAGDTDLFAGMADLRGSVDVALLPVWGWGPSLGPGHLDPERAAEAAALIAPSVAIPIHWGTFALGRPARRMADPEWPAREFARLTRQRASAVEVRVLAPGERTEV